MLAKKKGKVDIQAKHLKIQSTVFWERNVVADVIDARAFSVKI